MAKAAMSITIEKDLIDYIKKEAKAENRNVSNYIEVLINNQKAKRLEEKRLEQSFERAQEFTKNIKIDDYNNVLNDLMDNTVLTDYGQDILKKVQR